MSYMHIKNLYKSREILQFRTCYALEKVHGTSAHLSWRADRSPRLAFFGGSSGHENFRALFDAEALDRGFAALGSGEAVVFGEAHGGRLMKMAGTYGSQLRFIVFEARLGDSWLAVPDAEAVAQSLGLEFVPYVLVPTDIRVLDAERDRPSEVARRRGLGDRPREGVVLRPPFEARLNGGERVIAKHKAEAFLETATPRAVTDAGRLRVLDQAMAVAREWVTPMRLTHVLDRLWAGPRGQGPLAGPWNIRDIEAVIGAMSEDVQREAGAEVRWSRDVEKAVGRVTAELFRKGCRR
jgi:RNA ligase-like protein